MISFDIIPWSKYIKSCHDFFPFPPALIHVAYVFGLIHIFIIIPFLVVLLTKQKFILDSCCIASVFLFIIVAIVTLILALSLHKRFPGKYDLIGDKQRALVEEQNKCCYMFNIYCSN